MWLPVYMSVCLCDPVSVCVCVWLSLIRFSTVVGLLNEKAPFYVRGGTDWTRAAAGGAESGKTLFLSDRYPQPAICTRVHCLSVINAIDKVSPCPIGSACLDLPRPGPPCISSSSTIQTPLPFSLICPAYSSQPPFPPSQVYPYFFLLNFPFPNIWRNTA